MSRRIDCSRARLDVTDAVKCTEINIESFEVPAGKTFELDLLQGTTVNISGFILFVRPGYTSLSFYYYIRREHHIRCLELGWPFILSEVCFFLALS
jgi:hypothetical protein